MAKKSLDQRFRIVPWVFREWETCGGTIVPCLQCQDGNPGQTKDTNEHWRFDAGPAILRQQFESFEPPCGLPDVEG